MFSLSATEPNREAHRNPGDVCASAEGQQAVNNMATSQTTQLVSVNKAGVLKVGILRFVMVFRLLISHTVRFWPDNKRGLQWQVWVDHELTDPTT
jgi:hypothetical protein